MITNKLFQINYYSIYNTTSIISHKTDSCHSLYTLTYTSLSYKHMIQHVTSILHTIKVKYVFYINS